MMKSHYKQPLDDNFRQKMREIKQLAFRLLRESQNIRSKYFWNGFEADADPLASCIDSIIKHTMAAAFESRKAIQQLWLDDGWPLVENGISLNHIVLISV